MIGERLDEVREVFVIDVAYSGVFVNVRPMNDLQYRQSRVPKKKYEILSSINKVIERVNFVDC